MIRDRVRDCNRDRDRNEIAYMLFLKKMVKLEVPMIAIATDFMLIVQRAMSIITIAISIALSLQTFMSFLALLGQQSLFVYGLAIISFY